MTHTTLRTLALAAALLAPVAVGCGGGQDQSEMPTGDTGAATGAGGMAPMDTPPADAPPADAPADTTAGAGGGAAGTGGSAMP